MTDSTAASTAAPVSEGPPDGPPDGSAHPQDPARIRAMFNAIAPRYDLMNDMMSGGVHRGWKALLRARAGRPTGQGLALDLAGGTGDVADRLARNGWSVVVCDPSEGMMARGRARTTGGHAAGPPLRWVAGMGEALPFADRTFDLVTVSFGLRNMRDRQGALAEVARVLVPGGRFLCLEFSQPWRPIRGLYGAYSRLTIPRVGAAVAGRPEAYQYLVDSIRAFPDRATVTGWLEQAGLTNVTVRPVSLGIAAIHDGRRAAP
ncbi:class I SAM-dependent methyltransferase [Roseospira marina]|uniref:Ubiquinone/menaquinone biosynthesis C-methyltransferase UbiE n=1 Tax=Roseospira marina TaxID=140057 RepID=A0A5M6ID58_9PROT|nr:class I SAM-dependent methyltransferase [Roseospira marina]KAA5606196.1 class I SAM-dependent methyltransferase [Roseospira marina]MBB4314341.1 demethylmenaquinone methyltransferase/2-methoxy-6-polyprenyl-1,4-benzoquinol methylase [Roseospira marina]MBB5087501.1 demethylmenaquinone methyltransferase/2-methoxy-6-polyprenyl-1,4-benzoquinol methylase [Roseospira marina]